MKYTIAIEQNSAGRYEAKLELSGEYGYSGLASSPREALRTLTAAVDRDYQELNIVQSGYLTPEAMNLLEKLKNFM